MRTFITAIFLAFLTGCATPGEKTSNEGNTFGAILSGIMAGVAATAAGGNVEGGSMASPPADLGDRAPGATADAGVQFLEKARNDCVRKGWVYTDLGSGGGRCDPPQAAPPTPAPAPVFTPDYSYQGVEENTTCANYASRAAQQFQIMTSHPGCLIQTDGRWQPHYRNHYNWCLTAQEAWLRSEEKARDDHLYRCGGQKRFD